MKNGSEHKFEEDMNDGMLLGYLVVSIICSLVGGPLWLSVGMVVAGLVSHWIVKWSLSKWHDKR